MKASIHNLFNEPSVMPNNLDAIIRASGMTKKQVAKAAGIMPETLSRHIHGHVQMTLENAERYAEILNVSVQRVMFSYPLIPIIGENMIGENSIRRTLFHKWTRAVQIPTFTVADDLCCMENKAEKDYSGMWYEYINAFTFYLKEPIITRTVHPSCIQKTCLIRLENAIKLPDLPETKLFAGVLYPEPGNLYTIDSPKNGVHFRGVKLEWATPFVSALFRPDLRNITFADIESEI